MVGRFSAVIAAVALLRAGAAAPVGAQGMPAGPGLTASALSVYTPPACVPGVPFADIMCTTGFDPWIEQLGLDGITVGCGGGDYCPDAPVTRDQMAVFIERAMRGTANWPPHTVLMYHHPAAEPNSDLNSGAELLAMVAAIPTSGDEMPTASNRWIVRLGPGTFNLGAATLYLPGDVSLEGAGMDETELTGGYSDRGVVHVFAPGAGCSFARLTLKASGGDFATAAWVEYGKFVFDRTRLISPAGLTGLPTAALIATSADVEIVNASEVLTPVAPQGFGISFVGDPNHTLQVRNSSVAALAAAIGVVTGTEVGLAYNRIDGPLTSGGATFRCLGNYDHNFAPVTCP